MSHQRNSESVNYTQFSTFGRNGKVRSFCAMLLCIDDELSTYKLVDNLQDLKKTKRGFYELEQAIKMAEQGSIEYDVEAFTRYPRKSGLRVGIFSCATWIEPGAVVLSIGQDNMRLREIVEEKAEKDLYTEALEDLTGFYPIPRTNAPDCIESEILNIHKDYRMRWHTQKHLDEIKEEARLKVEAYEKANPTTKETS